MRRKGGVDSRQPFGLDRGGRKQCKGNERGKGREERGAEVAPPSRNGEGGRRVEGGGGSSGARCVKEEEVKNVANSRQRALAKNKQPFPPI